jgi:hypothetical protein
MFEFIETPFFTKAIDRYVDDDEYRELQTHQERARKHIGEYLESNERGD